MFRSRGKYGNDGGIGETVRSMYKRLDYRIGNVSSILLLLARSEYHICNTYTRPILCVNQVYHIPTYGKTPPFSAYTLLQ